MPPISIAVISFNSASTVLETLDSILAQTFDTKGIELVIADDASTDGTARIVDLWIDAHKSKFGRCLFIKGENNLGVAGNCNRAWRAATGEWIKTIAADDVLLPQCINSNLDFVRKNPQAKIVLSEMYGFVTGGEFFLLDALNLQRHFFLMNASEQFGYLLRVGELFGAPTSFISRGLLSEVGFADERFSLCEDYPLWLKFTNIGYKIFHNSDFTVAYRMGDSLSNSSSRLANSRFLYAINEIQELLVIPNLDRSSILKLRLKLWVRMAIWWVALTKNRKTFLSLAVYKIILSIKPNYASRKFVSGYIRIMRILGKC